MKKLFLLLLSASTMTAVFASSNTTSNHENGAYRNGGNYNPNPYGSYSQNGHSNATTYGNPYDNRNDNRYDNRNDNRNDNRYDNRNDNRRGYDPYYNNGRFPQRKPDWVNNRRNSLFQIIIGGRGRH